jgi:hypothetical protein
MITARFDVAPKSVAAPTLESPDLAADRTSINASGGKEAGGATMRSIYNPI